MAKTLRLTIKARDITPDVQLELAASSLEICYQDDDFYLLQADQMLLLEDGTNFEVREFLLTVQRPDLVTTPVTEQYLENIEPVMQREADFALAELNREDTHFELSTLMQVQDEQDSLGFLFAGKNNGLRGQQVNIASSEDPLSILNNHFQPPTEKIMTAPIIVAASDDIFSEANDFYSEGNVLKDLCFLAQDELKYPMQSNLNCLLPYHPEKLGYK